MKPLRKLLDNIKPKVEKNKYLHSVYDGIETFLFQPNMVTKGYGVHIRDGMDLKRTMVHVVLAMQLCLIFGIYNVGHWHYVANDLYLGFLDGFGHKLLYGLIQVLPIVIVAHVAGLAVEFYFAAKKGHAIEEGFLVTGMLIPLIMPPGIPLWMVALSTIFAVIIAKEAFGGTGMNILNIALTARVFIFFAYPGAISGDEVWIAGKPDTFSGATPLGLAAHGGWDAVLEKYSLSEMFWGVIPGSIGETSVPAVMIGAIMLVASGIGSWRIMLSMLVGGIVMAVSLNLIAANEFMLVPWYAHLFMGSFLFGMAFMATDPVTAAQTSTGKWIYGFMIGLLAIFIRVLNPAYPEGVMLAILFMNVFAPLIDHYIIKANMQRRLSRA